MGDFSLQEKQLMLRPMVNAIRVTPELLEFDLNYSSRLFLLSNGWNSDCAKHLKGYISWKLIAKIEIHITY